jgi:hypothetical protein
MQAMIRLGKRTKIIIGTTVSLGLMVAAVPLAIWITHTSGAQLENARRRCERVSGDVHKVVIRNGIVSPAHTEAAECDRLALTSLDNQQRLMAFGRHESHISYNGVSERLLSQGQSLTVTLVKDGTYLFHDHSQDEVRGTFTVRPSL